MSFFGIDDGDNDVGGYVAEHITLNRYAYFRTPLRDMYGGEPPSTINVIQFVADERSLRVDGRRRPTDDPGIPTDTSSLTAMQAARGVQMFIQPELRRPRGHLRRRQQGRHQGPRVLRGQADRSLIGGDEPCVRRRQQFATPSFAAEHLPSPAALAAAGRYRRRAPPPPLGAILGDVLRCASTTGRRRLMHTNGPANSAGNGPSTCQYSLIVMGDAIVSSHSALIADIAIGGASLTARRKIWPSFRERATLAASRRRRCACSASRAASPSARATFRLFGRPSSTSRARSCRRAERGSYRAGNDVHVICRGRRYVARRLLPRLERTRRTGINTFIIFNTYDTLTLGRGTAAPGLLPSVLRRSRP